MCPGNSQPSPSPHLSTPNPPKRPRLPASVSHYHSSLDISRGPLRTTSDGNLISEASGDWLLLETPPHDREDRRLEEAKVNVPAIGLPEAKNGATGLESARSRDGVGKMMRRMWSGAGARNIAAMRADEEVTVEEAVVSHDTETERVGAESSGQAAG
ncbi:hypothetical protein NX059_001431 [Plenodomus lindquistii]|nr:hypothetical protein NX059_001431 [Plenodomus lindquistii]